MPRQPESKARIRMGYSGYIRVRDRLFKDNDGECYYCFRKTYLKWQDAPDRETMIERMATIDHIDPVSRGGTWKKYNIVLSCRKCNADKADMSEEDYHEFIMKDL